jgi:hypothetical protein
MVRNHLSRLRNWRVAGIAVLLLAVLLAQTVVCARDLPVEIPYGSCDRLDGVIGTEWDSSLKKQTTITYQRTSCRCSASHLPTQLYLQHDEENLYVAMSIRTSYLQSSWETFRAFLFVDNGDNTLWHVGDNIVIVPADDGQVLVTGLDYYYPSYSRTPVDKATLDVQQDATGVGKWNPLARSFEFELSLPLQSGDPLDVAVVAGEPVIVVVGFDVVDSYARSLYHGKAPAFSLFVAP